MALNNKDKTGKAARIAHIIVGLQKNFPAGSPPINLDGAPMTIDQIVGQLQAFVDERAAIVAAQTLAHNKVAAERAGLPALNALVAALVSFLRNHLGGASEALADFGIPTRKVPAPQTTEQKAVAVARRNATRKARGTMGPKAKKAIHGSVTASIVVVPSGGGTSIKG